MKSPEPSPATDPRSGLALVYPIQRGSNEMAGLKATLSTEELDRAARFRFEHDAAAWMDWRAGLRRILATHLGLEAAAVPLVTTANGKPRLAEPHHNLHFNLSHCQDLAVIVVCRDGPVGIDLEPAARATDLLDCIDSFCAPGERDNLPTEDTGRAVRLLEIWTAKEALLKALGHGLAFPPQDLRIEGDRGHSKASLGGLDALKLLRPEPPDGYQWAIAVPEAVNSIVYVDS